MIFLFLILLFSMRSSSASSCPYYHGKAPKTFESGMELTDFAFGGYGNQIRCGLSAMTEAIRCGTQLKIPSFSLYSNSSSPLLFDFRKLSEVAGKGDDDQDCPTSFRKDNCKKFFYQKRFPLNSEQTSVLWKCLGVLISLPTLVCPNMENKLLIHIRNGDIYRLAKSNFPPQPQFSTLLGPLFVKRWKKVIVMSSTTNPFERNSGPIYNMFHALKVFFPDPVSFPRQSYEEHLGLWFCAENLVTASSTINTALPLKRHLKILFTPDRDCLTNQTMPFLREPFQQYRVPSGLHSYFWTKGKYVVPHDDDSYSKYLLTSSQLYSQCHLPPRNNNNNNNNNNNYNSPSSKSLSFEKDNLFHHWRHIFALPKVKFHENLTESLVIDLGNSSSFSSFPLFPSSSSATTSKETIIPFCGVFGAIVARKWKRVIVIEYPILSESLRVMNQAIQTLVGSLPTKIDFVPPEARFEMKIVNLATNVFSNSQHSPLMGYLSKDIDFPLNKRGNVQSSSSSSSSLSSSSHSSSLSSSSSSSSSPSLSSSSSLSPSLSPPTSPSSPSSSSPPLFQKVFDVSGLGCRRKTFWSPTQIGSLFTTKKNTDRLRAEHPREQPSLNIQVREQVLLTVCVEPFRLCEQEN